MKNFISRRKAFKTSAAITAGLTLGKDADAQDMTVNNKNSPEFCKRDENNKICTCINTPCPRHGICCECIAYHRNRDEFTGCYFPEKSTERSIDAFVKLLGEREPWWK